MTQYKEGDLVEAVKGERVIRDRIVQGTGPIYATRSYLGAPNLFTGNSIEGLKLDGYELTVIERAPESLPTEYGSVIRLECDADRRHVLAWLAGDRTWDLLDHRGNAHKEVSDPFAWLVEQDLTLERVTRLVPEVTS